MAQTDDICAPCPHRQGILCASQNKIDLLDQAHARILDLKEGDVLSWGDAKRRICDTLSLEAFDEICKPCAWQASGICRDALSKLKEITC